MSGNSNPGNFANRPQEEVQAAAKKGGESSNTGGFASMPTEKVVRIYFPILTLRRGRAHHVADTCDTVARNRFPGRQGFQRFLRERQ